MNFADIQREIADKTQAALCNVRVERANGSLAFAARHSLADRDAFGVAIVATHTLRYLDQSPPLAKGELLNIDGVAYRVIEPPRRLNAFEWAAELVTA